MKSDFRHQSAKNYIEGLAAVGRYHFTSAQAKTALGSSADATKLSLNRLIKQGFIASPARGFYVVVPPEYRTLGCLPADQFIPALMEWQGLSYYAGLLSAAQYYGAAHQRPQTFQVFLAETKNRGQIECGKVRAVFIARKRIEGVPIRNFNTPRGTIRVSTPEATAIDLSGYPRHAGGLDQVATVLAELAEQIDPLRLVEVAVTAPLPWSQRLGYLLEQAGAAEKTDALKEYVRHHARQYTQLVPGVSQANGKRASQWKLIINATVEPEL